MTLSCQGLTHMSNWRDQARHVSTFIWFNLHHRGRLSSLVYLLLIAICDISQANDVNKLPRNLGNTYKMECSIEMTFYKILWCSSIMKQSGWLRSVSTLICAAEIPFDITDCGVHIHWTKIYIDWKINQQQTTNCFDPCCAEFILRNISIHLHIMWSPNTEIVFGIISRQGAAGLSSIVNPMKCQSQICSQSTTLLLQRWSVNL